MAFDLGKYRAMFEEEAVELFSNMEGILLAAESSGKVEESTLNELFRAMHTLKGGSASVELSRFASFTHEVENFLDRLRNGELEYRAEMADLLLACSDAMKWFLDMELRDNLDEQEYLDRSRPLLERLGEFLSCGAKGETQKGDEGYGFFGDLIPEPAFESGIPSAGSEPFGLFEEQSVSTKSSEPFGFFEEQSVSTKSSEPFGFFESVGPNVSAATSTHPSSVQTPINNTIKQQPSQNATKSTSVNTIRVDLSKIDTLMNGIGELVISTSMLYQFVESISDKAIKNGLNEKIELLERHIRSLQESVMSTRMVPMEDIYAKFPKMIRDTAKKLNKQIEFTHYGDSVEIDKAMIEGLTDPLMHILRNSIDHGIESPPERVMVGKSEVGHIRMGAEQSNGQIVITISDDGKGIDHDKVCAKALEKGVITLEQANSMSVQEKVELIFSPGLSTASEVTDVSGRGVGMDVVKSNISKLGGFIKVQTERGVGTTMTIILPLTLAIVDGLNIRVGSTIFILPLASIVESLQPTKDVIKVLGDGKSELLMLRDEFIPVVRLHKLFNISTRIEKLTEGMLIVVKSSGGKIALFVDEFLNQQQVVIKPIDKNFKSISGIGGATVRGDGTIGLILDVIGIVEKYKKAA